MSSRTKPPVTESLAWVASELADERVRLLEIGAGEGHLAELLLELGHDVVALESSEEAVRSARGRGVRVERATWPAYEGGGFDVVLFVRSLHHMDDLDGALRKAYEVLRTGGRVLVEDFAFAETRSATIAWFRDQLEAWDWGRRGGPKGPDAFIRRLLEAEDPEEAWHRDVDHIHSVEAMRDGLGRFFEVKKEEGAPYLYRYLDGELDSAGLEVWLAREVEALRAGSISPVGRRFVAEKRR